MFHAPHEDRQRWLRRGVNVCLVVAWLASLMWLMSDAALACVYPDPLPGGCPADEARARARFEFWFAPLLLIGPAVILGASAGFSPQGRRYKPLWYALAILFFCAAPAMLVEAATTGFAVVDRDLTQAEHHIIILRLACGAAAAIGAPAGLAYLAHRRGRRTYAKAWAACSVITAVLLLVVLLSTI
ncbi:hypothetical protein AB0K52_23295 [Glycomyces sp. NPDC049804]|uniref:hypothetical protein n=1 Tax=Glycomyces sp. NPDC049804 TaxID=3154363 RepID=UPI003427254B